MPRPQPPVLVRVPALAARMRLGLALALGQAANHAIEARVYSTATRASTRR